MSTEHTAVRKNGVELSFVAHGNRFDVCIDDIKQDDGFKYIELTPIESVQAAMTLLYAVWTYYPDLIENFRKQLQNYPLYDFAYNDKKELLKTLEIYL